MVLEEEVVKKLLERRLQDSNFLQSQMHLMLLQQREQERQLEGQLPEQFVQHLEINLLQRVQRLELKQLVTQVLLEIVQRDHLQEEMEKLEALALDVLKQKEVHEVVLQEVVVHEVHLDLHEVVAQEVVDQVDQEVAVLEVLQEALQEVVELVAVAQKVVLQSLNLQVALLEKEKTKRYSIF